ncbi:MAG: hypothetical protein K2Q10_08680 [Rhodospirillales bacterium]|nr:hypothetical protein [Rhodospirillales bacterium]
MLLFCFASRNEENITRGFENKKWAVATKSEAIMAGRRTKAAKYLNPGDYGILYCAPRQYFTVPFIVKSKADPNFIEKDIWPEPWSLPFDIEPLGSPYKTLSAETARSHWPIIQKRWPTSGGVTAAMNITGVTVFVPVEINYKDWEAILKDLSTHE